jgi:hypothetical protein
MLVVYVLHRFSPEMRLESLFLFLYALHCITFVGRERISYYWISDITYCLNYLIIFWVIFNHFVLIYLEI